VVSTADGTGKSIVTALFRIPSANDWKPARQAYKITPPKCSQIHPDSLYQIDPDEKFSPVSSVTDIPRAGSRYCDTPEYTSLFATDKRLLDGIRDEWCRADTNL